MTSNVGGSREFYEYSQVEKYKGRQDHSCRSHLTAVQPFVKKEKADHADGQDHPHTVARVDKEGGKLCKGGQEEAGRKEVGHSH